MLRSLRDARHPARVLYSVEPGRMPGVHPGCRRPWCSRSHHLEDREVGSGLLPTHVQPVIRTPSAATAVKAAAFQDWLRRRRVGTLAFECLPGRRRHTIASSIRRRSSITPSAGAPWKENDVAAAAWSQVLHVYRALPRRVTSSFGRPVFSSRFALRGARNRHLLPRAQNAVL